MDDQVITFDKPTLFNSPEVLFQPSLGCTTKRSMVYNRGVSQLVMDAATSAADSGVVRQDEFLQHVVLAGGTTMFRGFGDRLQRDLQKATASTSSSAEAESKSVAAPSVLRIDGNDTRNAAFKGVRSCVFVFCF